MIDFAAETERILLIHQLKPDFIAFLNQRMYLDASDTEVEQNTLDGLHFNLYARLIQFSTFHQDSLLHKEELQKSLKFCYSLRKRTFIN